jgi:hypothetical protein
MWRVDPGMAGLFRNFDGESRNGHGLSTIPIGFAILFTPLSHYAIVFILFPDVKTVAIQ